MSEAVLWRAVRDHLKANTTLALLEGECAITVGPRPEPRSRDLFIAVHASDWHDDSRDHYHDEYIGVDVTVSMLMGCPRDRWGDKAAGTIAEGFSAFCRQVVGAVHRNYDLLTIANAEIGDESSGFVEPLLFRDGGRILERPGSWWGAIDREGHDKPCGISRTLSFAEARRVQHVGSYT